MDELGRAVVFRVDGRRYALPLSAVELVIRAVEVTPLPGAPHPVRGMIDVRGVVVPVLDMRRQLGLPEREIDPGNHFVIARTARRAVALVIDEAEGVSEWHRSAVTACDDVDLGVPQFKGVVKLDDSLVLIHDLERFLSADEARALDAAMERAQ